MSLTLYELVTADGTAISPYVWRSRFALAHKGLRAETVGVEFTDIPTIGDGQFRTVPVLRDGDTWIGDSWDIADYLDSVHPASPIFSSPRERAAQWFFDRWSGKELGLNLFRVVAFDIYERVGSASRSYFRESREKRLGTTLEASHATREGPLAEFRLRLEPARLVLRDTPFLGGSTPSYADYCLISFFIWSGSVATVPLLAHDDILHPWIERCLALYGGISDKLVLPALQSV